MITTTAVSLECHLREDLGLRSDDLVFLFSGVWGLGQLEGGLPAVTEAFRRVLPDGVLILPTFSYSWCRGEPYDLAVTPCPEMGVYPNSVVGRVSASGASSAGVTDTGRDDFIRTGNPNFSVAALRTEKNESLLDELFDIDSTCFGPRSIFGNIVRFAARRRALILLLGGAFKDCLFRCTFIHYVQQKVGVAHRYEKFFRDPAGSGRSVGQLVRYVSRDEYVQVNGRQPPESMRFPVEEDFAPFASELNRRGLLVQAPFAFYPSRMVSVPDCCGVFEEELRANPGYCVKGR